jgi:hypothetical protein
MAVSLPLWFGYSDVTQTRSREANRHAGRETALLSGHCVTWVRTALWERPSWRQNRLWAGLILWRRPRPTLTPLADGSSQDPLRWAPVDREGSRMTTTFELPPRSGSEGLLESCAGTSPVGSIRPLAALSTFQSKTMLGMWGKWEDSLMKSPSSRWSTRT